MWAKEVVRLAALAALLLAVGWGFGMWLNWSSEQQSSAWMRNLQFADSADITGPLSVKADSSAQLDRLVHQFRETGGRAYMHVSIMKYFYTRYYMALVMAAGAAVVAAFCLFHISKEGWNQARPSVQLIFVIAAGTALLLGVFPKLFRQDENIADNKTLYIQYVALGNEIRTYLATRRAELPNDTSVTLPEFVRHIDIQLATLHKIPVGFDQTKIPDYRSLQINEQK
jgi:hypothetical protein